MNYLFLLDETTMCSDTEPVWTIFGYIIWAIKIVVPLLLIVSGMIVMAKAVMSKEEKEIKSAQQHLVKKVIAAVIVYLIITITGVIVKLVSNVSWDDSCYSCVWDPFSCHLTNDPTNKNQN